MGKRLIAFPGMGADGRLFDAQRSRFRGLIDAPRLEPRPESSLSDYADQLVDAYDIGADCVLLGVSFGGVIAQAVAQRTEVGGLILIATAHDRAGIPFHLRFGERFLRLIPNVGIDAGKLLAPFFVKKFGDLTKEQKRVFVQMGMETSGDYIRWSCRAITDWTPDEIRCPVVRIHGSEDRILPVPMTPGTLIVPGAGHMVNLTHSPTVNEAIQQFLDSLWPAEE